MGDRNHIALERPLDAEDDITVVFYKVDSRGGDNNSSSSDGRSGDHDDGELPAERVCLHGSRGKSRRSNDDEERAEEEEENDDARRMDTGHGDGHLPEDGERKRLFCQPASCVSNEPPSSEDGAREGSVARAPATRGSPCLYATRRKFIQQKRQHIKSPPSVETRLYNCLSRRVSVDNVGGTTCTLRTYKQPYAEVRF